MGSAVFSEDEKLVAASGEGNTILLWRTDTGESLQTNDGHLIYMTYKGLRHGPKDVIDRLNRGEAVDPSLYYFRATPYFETGSEKYAWLNGICAVATGARLATGPTYPVFQIL